MQRRPRSRPRPAQYRLYARDELARFERLTDIVVSTHLQARYSIDDVAAGGQHDDRNLAGLADLPADIEAIAARQHDVQQQQIGIGPSQGPQALIRIRRAVERQAELLQICL